MCECTQTIQRAYNIGVFNDNDRKSTKIRNIYNNQRKTNVGTQIYSLFHSNNMSRKSRNICAGMAKYKMRTCTLNVHHSAKKGLGV